MATRKAETAENAAAAKASKVAKAVQPEVKETQQKVAQVKEAVEEEYIPFAKELALEFDNEYWDSLKVSDYE